MLELGRSGDVYNIGGGTELTNISLALMICKALDVKFALPPGHFERSIEFVEDRLGHDLDMRSILTSFLQQQDGVPRGISRLHCSKQSIFTPDPSKLTKSKNTCHSKWHQNCKSIRDISICID